MSVEYSPTASSFTKQVALSVLLIVVIGTGSVLPANEPDSTAAPATAAASDDQAGADRADVLELDRSPIQPVANIVYPDRLEGSPRWLERDFEQEPWTEDGVPHETVVTKVQMSEAEARTALKKCLKEAGDDRIDRLIGESGAADKIGYPAAEIEQRCLVEEPFVERVVSGHTNTTTWRAHALLRYDTEFEEDVRERWRQVTATQRLLQTGLAAGMVLLVLSTMFGYFKLDTATRGYYTARLQFATAGTILALVAAGVLVARWWGPWM